MRASYEYKKISLSLLCLVLISGCNKSNESGNAVTAISEENKVTIVTDLSYIETPGKEKIPPKFVINEKEATEVIINKYFSLYKDETVGNSFYSAYNKGIFRYTDDVAMIINDHESVTSYQDDKYVKTVFFNHKTGEVIKEIDGEIVEGAINNVVNNKYALLVIDQDFYLFDLQKKNIINDKYAVDIAHGPTLMIPFVINESEHFPIYNVATKDRTKIGLMDGNGNIIVEPKFNSLFFSYQGSKYLTGNLNGKYGLIDLNGNAVLDFKYDFSESYKDYIVASLNHKLYVYNNDLLPIIDGQIVLGEYEYIKTSMLWK